MDNKKEDKNDTTDRGLLSGVVGYGLGHHHGHHGHGGYHHHYGHPHHQYGYPPPCPPSGGYPPYAYPPTGYPPAGYGYGYGYPYHHSSHKPGFGALLAGSAAAMYGAHHLSHGHHHHHHGHGMYGYGHYGKFKHGKFGKRWKHHGLFGRHKRWKWK